jgi:hypothetical protein
MQRISVAEIFESSDIYLCAYLLTIGFSLWAVDASRDSDHVAFLLSPRPDLADFARYFEGKALVEVAAFVCCLRALKRELRRAKYASRRAQWLMPRQNSGTGPPLDPSERIGS